MKNVKNAVSSRRNAKNRGCDQVGNRFFDPPLERPGGRSEANRIKKVKRREEKRGEKKKKAKKRKMQFRLDETLKMEGREPR